LALTLQASPFSDPDLGDSHTASQSIIRRLSDSVTVLDSGEDILPLNPSTFGRAQTRKGQERLKPDHVLLGFRNVTQKVFHFFGRVKLSHVIL